MANEMVLMICSAKKRLTQKLRGVVARTMKLFQSPSRIHSNVIPLLQKSGCQVSKVRDNSQAERAMARPM